KTILEGICLEIERGKVYVAVGPNGGGKTMFLKLLAGIFEPTTGTIEVTVDGKTLPIGQAIYDHVIHAGFVFEHGGLINNMSIFENIALPLRYFETMSQQAIIERVTRILNRMQMAQDAQQRPAQLSLGNRKLVNVAMALANNPQLVLYDNPTLGLDIAASKAIKDLIKQLQTEYNLTSVIATNNLYFACDVADKVILIDNAKVVTVASPRDFLRSDMAQVKEYMRGVNIPQVT
ncbi:MAG TPA: ATP-binding cassette domain-containing protein, partial [Candidatus Omnitrophota bacterium]|nr:ATP-binding cassette domain-containing protein [Candidatus Omnitrophota bacterium]